MDYKKEIVRTVNNMKNEDFLMKIYYFSAVLFHKEAEAACAPNKGDLRKDVNLYGIK